MTAVAVTGLRVVVAVAGVRLLMLAALPANHATDDGETPAPWMRSGSRWQHHAHRLRRCALRTVAVIGQRTSTVPWLRRTPPDHLIPSLLRTTLIVNGVISATRSGDGMELLAGARVVALGAGAIAAVLAAASGGVAGAIAGCGVAAVAAMLPDLLLAHRARRQRSRVAAALPACLDLLAAALEAGLPLEAAVSRCAGHGGALDGSLARVAARVRVGSPPAQAFEAEATAGGVPQLTAIAALLRRHHALGLELPVPLRRLADDARLQREVALQERSATRAPMAALVTALLIAPSCLLALAVLLVGGLLAGGGPW
ncbi:MAG: type II secretion system F family protein [Chloroflexi bacterium]|nr:MAG: type II secretion system F family protein [Chloroflexota bacterium]